MADTRIFKLTEIAKSGDQATKTVFYTSDSTSGSVWVVKSGQMVVPTLILRATIFGTA